MTSAHERAHADRSALDDRVATSGAEMPANSKRFTPTYAVRWVASSTTVAEEIRAAHEIVELLIGCPLGPAPDEGPMVLRRPFLDVLTRENEAAQASPPISYRCYEGADQGQIWRDLMDPTVRKAKTEQSTSTAAILGAMAKELRKARRPAAIYVRPGRGGKQHTFSAGVAHALTGLEDYGEIIWRRVSKRADLGLLEVDPTGNAIVAHRLSGGDVKEGETFINQLRPNLALVEHYPELCPRFLMFALDMSGTRDVRQDRLIPAPGAEQHGERDDINFVLDAIHAGWCEHVVFRDGGRIARDVLPAEMILKHLKSTGTSLWLADKWGKLNYRTDRLALRASNMVSAEERDGIVERLERGQLLKGALAGNGWVTSTPFGFIRDRHTKELSPDPEQWPFILRAFELAASGACTNATNGVSTRRVAEILAAEGCPFDHDRVRTLLRDEIYATGHFTSDVKGQPIAQRPIPLSNPVSPATFARVKLLLELRQGATSRTPLGEFLWNYVHTEHERSEEHTSELQSPS